MFVHAYVPPAAELFVVRHVFTASDASHLPLQMGRIVEVVEKSNNGWWRGTIDDDTGWFPASYVTKIDGSASVPPRLDMFMLKFTS